MFENAPNQFIRDWLAYTGGGESPELFNLWSGISALSAVMGRRYIYREGRLEHWPNFYIIIIGPAAVRKSSAGKAAASIIRKHARQVRFGPTDTAGRKQGLLASYIRGWNDDDEEEDNSDTETPANSASKDNSAAVIDFIAVTSGLSNGGTGSSQEHLPTNSVLGLDANTGNPPQQPNPDNSNPFAKAAIAAQAKPGASPATLQSINPFAGLSSSHPSDKTDEQHAFETARNPRELYVFADELTTFIGLNQIDMTNCLTHLYYPDDNYAYTLARSEKRIPFPCLSLLGCTTPTALASHLPPAAVGQGLTSRCIFVYESKPGARVFPPPEFDKRLAARIGKLFTKINSTPFDEFDAVDDLIEIERTDAAFNYLAKMYAENKIDLGDSRFTHYEQRRQEHLCKLAMVLAVGENRHTIELRDAQLANEILAATELNMPNALGDIGMDKITQAKQELREYLENSWPIGLTIKQFERNARRNMTAAEFKNYLVTILESGQAVVEARTFDGQRVEMIIPKMPKAEREKLNRTADQKELADIVEASTKTAAKTTRKPDASNPFANLTSIINSNKEPY